MRATQRTASRGPLSFPARRSQAGQTDLAPLVVMVRSRTASIAVPDAPISPRAPMTSIPGGSRLLHALLREPEPLDLALRWLEQSLPFPGYLHLGTDAQRSVAELVKARVPAGGSVLDIGCGPCDKTAVLSRIGYRCTGIDDFGDRWHREGDNLARIRAFAESAGVRLVEGDGASLPFEDASFDAVMLCDVIEHLHASPRTLLTDALRLVKDGGWLVVSVPNALNLRKRIDVLRGRTNYPPYDQFFRSGNVWRGHVREYSWGDLSMLPGLLGLTDATVHGRHHMLGVLPTWLRAPYRIATASLPSMRDTLVLCARRPQGWARSRAA